MADGDKIPILIVEDEGLFRGLLRIVLSRHPRLEVVGAFADSETAIARALGLRPQVVILDIELGAELNDIQVGLRLRQLLPDLGVVLLSNHGDPQFVASLLRNEVAGWSYLLKQSVSDAEALVRAIEGAADRLVVLDPRRISACVPARTGRSGG